MRVTSRLAAVVAVALVPVAPWAVPTAVSATQHGSVEVRSTSSTYWVWDDTVAQSPLGQSASDHQIAVSADGQVQTAAWSQQGTWFIIYTRTSRDGGATWDTAVAQSRPGYQGTAPSLAVSSSGQVQGVTWTDGFAGVKIVRFARTTNGGVSWDDSVALTPMTSNAESPRLAVSSDGSVMSAVWSRLSTNWRVETRRSITSGGTWDDSIHLNTPGTNGFTPWIALTPSGARQAALWTTYNDAIARESSNTASSWDDSVVVGPNGGNLFDPQIAMSSDGLLQMAAWRRLISGYYVIQVTASSDGGATWLPPVNLSVTGGEAQSPQIAMSADGRVQTVAWARNDGSHYIVQSRTSSDGGSTWGAVVEHSGPGSNSQNPAVAMSSDGVRQSIAFSTNTGAVSDLIVRTSGDSGASWDDTVTVARNARQNADPRIAMSQDGTSQTVVFRAEVGASTIIQSATATWVAPPSPPVPPAPPVPASAPTSVRAEAGDTSAAVEWIAPAFTGSYPITTYMATASAGGRVCLVASPATRCEVTGLTNGVAYTFVVKALTGAGWSMASEPSNAVTPTPVVQPSIVITGSRGDVQGGPGILVSGTSTGLGIGAILHPWTRFPGEVGFRQGIAKILVSTEGTFEWQRRTGKRVSVYVQTADRSLRSNPVTIR